jgi:hypothetical protein
MWVIDFDCMLLTSYTTHFYQLSIQYNKQPSSNIL